MGAWSYILQVPHLFPPFLTASPRRPQAGVQSPALPGRGAHSDVVHPLRRLEDDAGLPGGGGGWYWFPCLGLVWE